MLNKFDLYKIDEALERFKHIEKSYNMFAKMQKRGINIKPFFKVLLNFFKKIFTKFIGMINTLKAFMKKGYQEWEL